MTFGEFVREVELYEYSQENYDLVKECAELQVIGRYIDNQKFIAENAAFVESAGSVYGDGYFMESVSENDIQALEESFKTKAGNIASKLKNAIKKAWITFCNFITKIFGRLDADGQAALKLIEEINKNCSGYSESDYKRIADTLNTWYGGNKDMYFIQHSNKIRSKMKVHKLNTQFIDGVINAAGNAGSAMAAAIHTILCTDTMIVFPLSNDRQGMDPNKIANYVKQFINAKSVNDIKAITAAINAESPGVLANGIEIDTREKSVKKTIDNLNKVKEGMDNASFFDPNNSNVDADFFVAARELQYDINKIISGTIESINNGVTDKKRGLTALQGVIKTIGAGSKKNEDTAGLPDNGEDAE